ncbi:MAG: serine hydrolase [Bacteroidota bacterium]|nr:serine hydrolase [Bacteroidota bacterium]MDE2834968.1 serine hydrolase [Bacteroidota bacterium]
MRHTIWLITLAICCGTVQAQVDSLLKRWDRLNTPGAAVAVIQNGQVVHKRGYGQASLEHHIPVTPTTVFDAASVSKQFTAYAVAMLAHANKLSLDDNIRTHLPAMPDWGETITIRHLIHHTGGLRDWPGMLAMAGRSMEDVISFEEIITMARHQTALNFAPGEQYSYSNTGYALLALIVERVAGMSFREYTDRYIFRPLGMLHTWFQDDHEEQVMNRAYGYTFAEGAYRRVGNGLMGLGSSSLHTTLDNLILWTLNFMSRQIGSDAVHALMEQPGTLNSGSTTTYAFGQVVGSYRGLRTVSHSGSWAGFRSMLLRIPEHDFSVILLSNTADISAPELVYRIADAYLDLEPAAQPAQTIAHADIDPGAYTGTYDANSALIIRLAHSDSLLQAHLPAAPPVVLQPIGADSFFVPAWNIPVSFSRNTEGTVTHMAALGQSLVRETPPADIHLQPYAGGYYSMELKVNYSLLVRNNALIAVGPRGDEFTLIPAKEDVFVTDRWYMPVVRFMRDADDRLTHFEASNGRSLGVEFRR